VALGAAKRLEEPPSSSQEADQPALGVSDGAYAVCCRLGVCGSGQRYVGFHSLGAPFAGFPCCLVLAVEHTCSGATGA
jgi:hypothetical protein